MEAYETLGVLGEGTYGVVIKARHCATGRLVAIKKYKQTEDDDHVRKTSLREVRLLKQLRHPNIISLLEVFRRDGKLYLVFEYVENTILQLIEATRHGLSPGEVRRYTFQLLNGLDYCHAHNIIHRDVKPENILVSKDGVLKLCDFGFARQLSAKGKYTDYVATRWYRAPELLVGDVAYGKAVDLWAIGCIFSELTDGQPLFPGESDLDQLSLIMHNCGPLPERMVNIFQQNRLYRRVSFPNKFLVQTLRQRFSKASEPWMEFLTSCLRTNPAERLSCASLMSLPYFTTNNFRAEYEAELRVLMCRGQSPNLGAPSPDASEDEDSGELLLPHIAVSPVLPSTGMEVIGESFRSDRISASFGIAQQSNNMRSSSNKNKSSGSGNLCVPFHPLGRRWSQFFTGSAVNSSVGELPSIGNRQHQQQQQQHHQQQHPQYPPLTTSLPTPVRNSLKNAGSSARNEIDFMGSSTKLTTLTSNPTLEITPTSSSPMRQNAPGATPLAMKSKTITKGRGTVREVSPWRRGNPHSTAKNDAMPWREGSLKKSIRLNYHLPVMSGERTFPIPSPYPNTSSIVLTALSTLRDNKTNTGMKGMHDTHKNTAQTKGPKAGNPPKTTMSVPNANIGGTGGAANKTTSKPKKKNYKSNKDAFGGGP